MHWIKLEHVYMTLCGQSQWQFLWSKHQNASIYMYIYLSQLIAWSCVSTKLRGKLSVKFWYKTPKPTSKFYIVPQVWPRSSFEVLLSKIDIYFGKFYLFISISANFIYIGNSKSNYFFENRQIKIDRFPENSLQKIYLFCSF